MSRLPNSGVAGETATLQLDSNPVLEWQLRPWWRAALFLLPVFALGGSLAWQAVRVAWLTATLDSFSIIAVQKALQDEPDNSDLIHHLGLIYTYNSADINLSDGVKYLRRTVELNPRHWDFWADLGAACDFVGDVACSDAAFERARSLNPMTPSVEWAVANHYLLTDREAKSYLYFRNVMNLDPEYLDPTLRLCLRATGDPQAIYAEVVPHGTNALPRFGFLTLLTSTADFESAMRIWAQMISGPDRSPDLSLVKPFMDTLIDHGQIQDAGIVWKDLQKAGVVPLKPDPHSGNLLYDGNFDRTPLNTGFDWRIDESPYLVYNFSDPSGFNGGKCLRIDFAVGQNAEDDLLDQVVLVEPATSYHLTAYARSQNLTSESGPRLQVMELGCGNCGVRASDATLGTTPWHPIDVTFLTQPQTRAVRISFVRPEDVTFSRDITGSVWLDNVDLRTAGTPPAAVNQMRTR